MILKGIDVGNPQLSLLFKLLRIDSIVAIKNFSNQVFVLKQNEIIQEDLELTVLEYCEKYSCRLYVK
jgi:hypothetical protein